MRGSSLITEMVPTGWSQNRWCDKPVQRDGTHNPLLRGKYIIVRRGCNGGEYLNGYRSRVQARLCQKFDEVAHTADGKGSGNISVIRRDALPNPESDYT
jgi:hypothetical protein